MNYKLALSSFTVFVSACSLNDWAIAPQSGDTARLRVVSLAPGNSFIGVTRSDSCEESDALMYGWFNPGASESWQASRRGFNRRIGMPSESSYRAHLFAEHQVAAATEMTFFATSTAAQSPSPYDVDVCRIFKRATLSPNRSYELVLGRQGGMCSLEMFELVSKGNGDVTRIQVPLGSACGKPR